MLPLDPIQPLPNLAPLVVPQGFSASSHAVTASSVPDIRQTMEGVTPVLAMDALTRADMGFRAITIYHPQLVPSAETTENALMARSLLMPLYIHDSAATRMARLSNLHRDAPRFGNAINICA